MTLARRISTLTLTLLVAVAAGAQVPSLQVTSLNARLTQSPRSGAGSVRDYRRAHEHEILREFLDLLAIPNVASDRENIRRNAAAIVAMMQRRKLQPRLLETKDPSVPPVVYGEWTTPGATRTLIFYAHYDGQPTDPKQWSGSLPWQPVLRTAALEAGGKILTNPKAGETINPEWRLYGRSAADDKAGVMAILSAFDALIAAGLKPTANLKFVFEGEEEAGSPHLGEILRQNKQLLQSDAWIICDASLNINGISSGDVGALARNVIPTTASAVLDLRLVKGNDHERQVRRLIDHIRKQGFYVIDHDPTDEERQRHPLIARVSQRPGGYNAERTRMDLDISRAIVAAVQSTSSEAIVRLPTAGGSLPLSVITANLSTVTMTVPIANYDNNQHAENENLRLQNLWDGIETMTAIMTMR